MQDSPWSALKIMETASSYWRSCTLHAAIGLDLFTHLGDRQRTATDMARAMQTDPHATAALLDALSAMQLLQKNGDRFQNSSAARTYLSRESSEYLGYIVGHHRHLIASWSHLDRAVTTGEPQRNQVSRASDNQRENFLMGMFNIARNLAPRVVPKIDLSGRRHLLDLGGGPGTWAIYFCRHNPKLKATVCDLATTQPFAEKTIQEYGLTDRIDFKALDFLTQPVSGRYDAAWLSHILHAEGPADCARIIEKAAAVVEPGGLLMVHEFVLDDSLDSPLFPALFSLNMLLGTESGHSYSESQIMGWLAAAGTKNLRRLHLETPNDSDVILGEVQPS